LLTVGRLNKEAVRAGPRRFGRRIENSDRTGPNQRLGIPPGCPARSQYISGAASPTAAGDPPENESEGHLSTQYRADDRKVKRDAGAGGAAARSQAARAATRCVNVPEMKAVAIPGTPRHVAAHSGSGAGPAPTVRRSIGVARDHFLW
jgi:hypothetical protein